MTALLFIIPIVLISLSVFFAKKRMASTNSPKKAFSVNILTFLLLIVFVSVFAVTAFASGGEPADANTPVVTSANAEEEEVSADSSNGLKYLSAALVTGLAGIGGGIAIAAAAPAAIGATSEDPKVFGKALIFVALGEAIALYGVIISILILNN